MERRYKLENIPENASADLTPLNLAILREFETGAEVLADVYKADISIPDKFGLTPLHMACMRGYFPLVRLLVEKREANIELKDKKDRSPAVTAEDNRHMQIYHYLTADKVLKSQRLKVITLCILFMRMVHRYISLSFCSLALTIIPICCIQKKYRVTIN